MGLYYTKYKLVYKDTHLQFDMGLYYTKYKRVYQYTHLQFDMGLYADRNVAAHVGVGAVFLQEAVATHEDVAQPLENLRVVDDLVLDQSLRDVEQHLRAGENK